MFKDKRTGIFQCKINGKQISLKTTDRRDAKRIEFMLRKRNIDQTFGVKRPSQLKVSDCFELWISNRNCQKNKAKKENYDREYRMRVEQHILKHFGNRLAQDLTAEEIHQWAELKLKHLSEGSVDRLVHIFRSMIKAATNPIITTDYLMYDPVRIWPKFKTNYVGVRLTNEEIAILLNSDHKSYIKIKDVCLFALYTGLRRQNICNLKWSQIDLQSRTITIPEGEYKSGVEHKIPIIPQVLDVLARQIGKHENFVFVKKDSTPFNITDLSRQFRLALPKIGFKRQVRFHDLRHTCGTRLIESGILIEFVKEYLGHSTSKTTERYIHMCKSHLKAALTGFDIDPQARPSQMSTETN